jgi:hypothetical protein
MVMIGEMVMSNHTFTLPRIAFAVLLVVGTSSCLGGGPREFASVWRDRTIAIDGDLDDWAGAKNQYDDANATLRLMNDHEALYIGLAFYSEPVQMQLVVSGLTMWFDTDGGELDKVLGVCYPLGFDRGGEPPSPEKPADGDEVGAAEAESDDGIRAPADVAGDREREGGGAGDASRGHGGPRPPDLKEIAKRVAEHQTELMWITGADSTLVPLSETAGLEVAIGYSRSRLIYELRMPLAMAPGSFGISTSAGGSVLVGLESPKVDFDEMRERMGGSAGGGPAGGPAGGGGGATGGMAPGARGPGPAFVSDDIESWARIQTATEPLGAPAIDQPGYDRLGHAERSWAAP